MRHGLLAVLLLAPLPVASLAQVTAPPSPLVQRFLERQDAPLVSYRAVRRLEASNERFNKQGWMDVEVELSPKRGFTYLVVAEGGSGYIRDRILRKTLEGEADAVRRQDPTRAALILANYSLDAAVASEPGQGSIRIRPRRADMFLVDGVMTINAEDGDLLSVQGRLAKSPSFWTRRVDILRRYGRVSGVRVPLVTESTAEVRFAGRSSFRMTSSYLQVNGIDVDVAMGQ